MYRSSWKIIFALIFAFALRFTLSFTIYNGDINNHIAWMDSVNTHGWVGLYDRDLSPWATVNYPPLTLYSFYLSQQLYHLLPVPWQVSLVQASLYKIWSILADSAIAYLIWRFAPFPVRWRKIMMGVFLFNPALLINSVFWGQIESLSALAGVATILSLVHKRGDIAILAFVGGLLLKQNILPLTPLLLVGVYLSHTPLRKIMAAISLSAGVMLLLYLPLIPLGTSIPLYISHVYLSSVGGQLHQHLSSLNALNLWYFLGLNQVSDATTRLWGQVLSGLGVVVGFFYLRHFYSNRYLGYWLSAVIISLWTFIFATRMHERHSYMAIVYLTFLLPYRPLRWLYIPLSLLSFYNVYGVWMEYFATPPTEVWSNLMPILAGVFCFLTLTVTSLPLQLLHQNRIKS